MTRGVFDPTGGNPERSGSRYTPPDADQISQLPEEFTNPRSPIPTGTVDFRPPPEKLQRLRWRQKMMANCWRSNNRTFHKEDYERFLPIVENAVQKHGKVRMLVQMHHFQGWDAQFTYSEDVKFDAKHFNHLERLAIVGETTWENGWPPSVNPSPLPRCVTSPLINSLRRRSGSRESDARRGFIRNYSSSRRLDRPRGVHAPHAVESHTVLKSTRYNPSVTSQSSSNNPQIVVAGHVCLDIIPAWDPAGGDVQSRMVSGALLNVGPATLSTGGAVSNVGIALHRLGVPNAPDRRGNVPSGKSCAASSMRRGRA